MTGYFFVADLLGFGNIVRNSNSVELVARIGRWTSLVDSLSIKTGVENIQLISDTVFASSESTSDGLKRLIDFSRSMLNEGTPQSLPIRGAITHGDFDWGRLTYGRAVIDAHDLEACQNWIGVSCGDLPHVGDHWGFGSLVAYPSPLKSGPIMIRPVIDWEVPPATDLTSYLCHEGLTHGGEHLQWALGEKLNNTVQFSVYKSIIRTKKGRPDQFYGFSAMEAIELHMLGKLRPA